MHRRMVNKGCHVNAVHVKRLLYLSCRERWCLIVPLGRGRSKVPRALCTRPYLVSGHTHSVKWSHPLPLKFLCELIAYVGCRHTHYPTHQLADTHRLRTHPPIASLLSSDGSLNQLLIATITGFDNGVPTVTHCLLYTSPSPRDS